MAAAHTSLKRERRTRLSFAGASGLCGAKGTALLRWRFRLVWGEGDGSPSLALQACVGRRGRLSFAGASGLCGAKEAALLRWRFRLVWGEGDGSPSLALQACVGGMNHDE
jgi:hypothetical protein